MDPLAEEAARKRRCLVSDNGHEATDDREDSMTYGGDKRMGMVFGGKPSTKDVTRDESEELSG